MSPRQKRRLMVVALIVAGIGVATALTLTAFRQNMLYFITPSEVKAGALPADKRFRIGGLVVEDSVERDGVDVEFGLTDGNESVTVRYSGILPDLFREGQGIVALGVISDGGVFHADEVLAKHDENYMPPEVADALKDAENVDELYEQAHGE
ncbi:MAG TPA: cytochrome c maturation protein CcmE [Arenicellales bacterium]|nr:cytochrome c maturation protein CcmE [Arenicellales bacterium]